MINHTLASALFYSTPRKELQRQTTRIVKLTFNHCDYCLSILLLLATWTFSFPLLSL